MITETEINQEARDILIIGAGIAGLLAAVELQAQGMSVLVLERGPTPGGRMISRTTAVGVADLGAQFFTVRHDRFGAFVNQWLANGRVFEWARGWGEDDGFPRYAGVQGMGQIAAACAQSLPVRTGVTITAVTPTNAGWRVMAENGQAFDGRALLLTPPVPQSLALLKNGDTRLHSADDAALCRVRYAPSITGLFLVTGGVNLPHPGAVQAMEQPIVWIADNQSKGLTSRHLLTAHAGPVYSAEFFEADENTALAGHLAAVRPYLQPNAGIETLACKRWPFALPLVLHPERTLLARGLPPLAFAGDAFHEPRVEGAALSGLAAADALRKALDG